MKTAKLIIGIVSIVLFGVIVFQSCAAGIGNALEGNGEISGSAGFFLALCMLIAGISGICTRKGVVGGFVCAGFYAIGGLVGIANYGSYGDLAIWSVLCFLFAAVFVIGSIMTKCKKSPKNQKEGESNEENR
ncbi:MAG: hypothetical protein ACI3XR_00740 [Eubacteriales bacterium]